MAYSNIDQAVTYQPNQQLAGFAQQLYAQNERNKLLRQREAEEQRGRQDALVKYVGSSFEDKDYMTGSAYDPVINKQLADIRQKYAGILQKPGANMADVQFMMQKDLGEMTSMSSNIKAIRANIDQQVKTYGKYPGIDPNALQQVALTNAFYKTDPTTGRRTLKTTNELDPNEDYIQSVIRENPDLVAKGDQGLRNQIKTFQPQSTGDAVTREVKGVTTEHKYTAKLPPYMQLVKDQNGIATGVEVRSETLPNIKNPDGTPVKVADQDTYQAFITDPASAVALNSMFKTWNNSQRTKLDPGSEEADIMRRKLLFDYLGKNGVYEFKPESRVTNNSLVDKQQMGVPLYRQGLSDGAKLAQGDQKLKNNDAALMLRAMGGDQVVLEGAEPKEVGGKTFYDISKSMGGMKLGYDADRKPIYANEVLVDPISKEVSITGTDGKVNSYSGKQVREFVKRTAEFNGLSLDKADRTLNMYTDKDGAYTGKQDTEGMARAQADREVKAFNARKEVIGVADNFAKSKNVDFLPALKGVTLKDGIIEDAGKQGLFSSGAYFIKINGEKKVFDTAYLLSEYIKNNVK